MTRTHIAKWLTLLSVVLALALTAALAACGSDEPSGVTGPDRTECPPTETPGSPARTPSTPGSGAVPTATDAPAASGSDETDREALVAFYNATNGENWYGSDNWLSDAPLGQWDGVTTNDDGRVTGLWLSGYYLRGEIPPELGSLSNLTTLRLDLNELSGEIPPELGNLSNLVELDLNFNGLIGEIPPELGSLSNLTTLYLAGNELSEEIPAELGNLANLQALDIRHSQLSGPIPPELGSLSNLTFLYLNLNQLSGELPRELGNLAKLQKLHLGGNQFEGCVPLNLQGPLSSTSDLGDLPFCRSHAPSAGR